MSGYCSCLWGEDTAVWLTWWYWLRWGYRVSVRVVQDKALPNLVYRVCTGSMSDQEKRKAHVSALWTQKTASTRYVYGIGFRQSEKK